MSSGSPNSSSARLPALPFSPLPGQDRSHVSFDKTRRYRINRNSSGGELLRYRFRQPNQPSFACSIVCLPRISGQSNDAGHVDNAPGTLLCECPAEPLCERKCSSQIGV